MTTGLLITTKTEFLGARVRGVLTVARLSNRFPFCLLRHRSGRHPLLRAGDSRVHALGLHLPYSTSLFLGD